MLAKFYQNNILKKPSLILILLLICLCFFGYNSKKFRLDASSETLLIEGDPDLKYLNEINERYGAKEFLVLTYTPKKRMIDESSIKNLLKLKNQIQQLDWVHNVITLLDIPLLSSSDDPLIERLQNYSTLKSPNIDKERGFNEILNSPVFRNFVISEDGKTSGIIVYLKSKDKVTEFKSKFEEELYKDNLKKLRSYGNIVLPVGKGPLSSGLDGKGRMLEPTEIVSFLINTLLLVLLASVSIVIVSLFINSNISDVISKVFIPTIIFFFSISSL